MVVRASGSAIAAGRARCGEPMIELGETRLGAVERTLVRLCRRDAGAALGDADLAALEDEPFREELWRLASAHRVAGLVGIALRARGIEPWRQPLDSLRIRAAQKQRELERLLGKLRAERLEPVVLKGPALRSVAYADPVERPYSDFDLLFPAEQVDRAIGVAEAAGYAFPFDAVRLAGYRSLHFHLLLRQPNRFRVEIHWALSAPREPFRLDPQAFLARSRRAELSGGAPARIPCAEHLLLHMAHENLRDSLSRLGRIVDLDRIVASSPELDWDYAAAQAEAGGLRTLLALSLELARALLGTPVPPEVRRRLRPDAAARRQLERMRPAAALLGRSLCGGAPGLALLLGLVDAPRDRVRLLRRVVSGRRFAEHWIFRPEAAGPPSAPAALVAGLKEGLRLAAHHASRGLVGRLEGRPPRSEP